MQKLLLLLLLILLIVNILLLLSIYYLPHAMIQYIESPLQLHEECVIIIPHLGEKVIKV